MRTLGAHRTDAPLAAGFALGLVRSDARPEYKAEALMGMGQVHANVLDMKRDPEKALAAYRQLVDDYPESKLRQQAEREIQALEGAGSK